LDTPEPTQGQTPEPTPNTTAPSAPSETSGTNSPSNGPTNGPAAPATRREATPPAPSRKYYTITELNEAKPKDMLAIAKEFSVTDITPATTKPELITRILQAQTEAQGNIFAQGILEIVEDGFGFLRRRSLLPSPDDVYVGSSQVRRLGLRTGDYVTGQTRPPKDNEKYFSLLRVEAVNGVDPEVAKRRPLFEALTPVFPDEMFDLEIEGANLSQRLINLVNPLGFGQRALIVSPPKAGKTTLLKDIANGIAGNHPDVHIMVVLVGERPEEVTDIRRSIKGEVFSSTFDEPTENHTRVAELALERAKRLVETGRDVAILLGSHALRWYGPRRAIPAEALLRSGAQHRGRERPAGRIALHLRHLSGRHRQPHGRRDLRRVQGHR
jgi:transcription termination factor Rho